ncbi:GGDEF domain-containing protein [Sphingomonas sp. Leaf4]|uniref:GGDEF domain-containing protein n=1 Tax=Sphingomonas sp. Leaf4 TaxID=2876553 RepID=UPI001E5E084C|nr:GGDEF domain-containing protein [Sphingomonas sp. Leaf4]
MNRPRARLSSRNPLLSWLVQPGAPVRANARPMLLAELLSSPVALFLGAANGLLVLGVAWFSTHAAVFLAFAAIELALLTVRVRTVRRIEAERARGEIPAIDASVVLSILWCALQGAVAATIMLRAEPVLMIVSTTMIMGVIAPICARNYAAPRLAMLLVLLCDVPFKLGAALSGIPLLLAILPMMIPFVLGIRFVLGNFNRTLIATLEAEEANRHLARHDALTGLLNRYGLDEALTMLPHADDRAMAVLCLDLDGFKGVNDRLGHAAGDRLLAGVAARLLAATGPDDIVARLGGDEFMIVVRHMPPAAVDAFASGLIDRIAGGSYDVGDTGSAMVGASIGYACFPEDAATSAELRTRADAALYAAKDDGKGTGRRYAPRPGDRFSSAA